MNKKVLFLTILVLSFVQSSWGKDGFAIVVDKHSYQNAKTEIEAYAACVESINKYKVYLVVDQTGIPDSIRNRLIELYHQKEEPIVGAVFIGDIPIAMIRDAQFMTSAFKMNQKMDRRRSSIPSDRFYDSFSLKFKSLGKDEERPYYYYSLTANSSQILRPDIFSGRIRPTDSNGTSKIEKLRAYLQKVVVEKQKRSKLHNIFYFSGHGYISESKVARMDEKQAYYEHFPELKSTENKISYLDHTDFNPIKENLMNEVMRTDLSLAILHHHGSNDTQYLNGLKAIRTVKSAKEFIIRNAREHVYIARQRGRNSDSLRIALEKRFDLPQSWLLNAYNDSLAKEDSLYDAASDLHLEDFKIYGYKPNVPVVLIDACFCGSYHLDDCIANEYIFQEGSTVSVIANSVNVLQDKWSDRFLGLIELGGCVGHIVQLSSLLESHVIGDPTFNYRPQKDIDVAHLLKEGKTSSWRKLLKSNIPELQTLAINQLGKSKKIASDQLLEIIQSSPYGIVRLEALFALSSYKDDNFIVALEKASQDSYELLQRQAIRFIGKSGNEKLIPALIKLAIANNTSDRCNFNVMTALSSFPKDKLVKEFIHQFDVPSVKYIHKDSVRKVILKAIEGSSSRLSSEVEDIMKPDVKEKDKIFTIRAMRNTLVHYWVPQLLQYLEKTNDENLQILLLESLGWHPYSYQAPQIARAALKMSKDTNFSEKVREEALKTYKRINEY